MTESNNSVDDIVMNDNTMNWKYTFRRRLNELLNARLLSNDRNFVLSATLFADYLWLGDFKFGVLEQVLQGFEGIEVVDSGREYKIFKFDVSTLE